MNQIELHDAFVPEDCPIRPSPAVSLGAACMWIDAYTAVATKVGRYVQGGGFGSFSKRYVIAAAGLLQAEIVTADCRRSGKNGESP
jgi:hypothetical protein